MGNIENLKITAIMASPLCGDAPYLDALLTYMLAFKSNKFESKKFNKATPLEEFKRLPIPITQIDINDIKLNNCSDPILSAKIADWHDSLVRKFETDKLSLIIDPQKRKTINSGGGHLRSIRKPLRLKSIDKIVWFARGEAKEVKRLLGFIHSIGFYRKIGYGIISKWIVEKHDKNNSLFCKMGNDKILMKTVPVGNVLKNINGYRIGFGACVPPYWHPGNFMEVAIPC